MNKELQFFDYGMCYNHYVKRVDSLHQKHTFSHVNVAKPVLLVAIIDAIEGNVFNQNHFSINDWVEKRYKVLMSHYSKDSLFGDKTSIEKPFWHLETDGFWHLKYPGEHPNKCHTPSKVWLKENVDFAYFDESLWILLQNKVWRTKLRDYIVEHKLTEDSWSGKMVAEGLGFMAAILLTA